ERGERRLGVRCDRDLPADRDAVRVPVRRRSGGRRHGLLRPGRRRNPFTLSLLQLRDARDARVRRLHAGDAGGTDARSYGGALRRALPGPDRRRARVELRPHEGPGLTLTAGDEEVRRLAKLIEPLRVEPGRKVRLERDFDPRYKDGFLSREDAEGVLQAGGGARPGPPGRRAGRGPRGGAGGRSG